MIDYCIEYSELLTIEIVRAAKVCVLWRILAACLSYSMLIPCLALGGKHANMKTFQVFKVWKVYLHRSEQADVAECKPEAPPCVMFFDFVGGFRYIKISAGVWERETHYFKA